MNLIDPEKWRAEMAARTLATEHLAIVTAAARDHVLAGFKDGRYGWRVARCRRCKQEVRVTGSTIRGAAILERVCDPRKEKKPAPIER